MAGKRSTAIQVQNALNYGSAEGLAGDVAAKKIKSTHPKTSRELSRYCPSFDVLNCLS